MKAIIFFVCCFVFFLSSVKAEVTKSEDHRDKSIIIWTEVVNPEDHGCFGAKPYGAYGGRAGADLYENADGDFVFVLAFECADPV